jgi:hypothetical protein
MAKIQTDKQRKLVKLVSENLGTMMHMMLEAGYSDESARRQSTILVGIRDELDPIVQKLEAHRLKVIDRFSKKLDAFFMPVEFVLGAPSGSRPGSPSLKLTLTPTYRAAGPSVSSCSRIPTNTSAPAPKCLRRPSLR